MTFHVQMVFCVFILYLNRFFFFVVKKVNCMDLNNMKNMNFLIVAESSFDDGLAFRCGLMFF